MIPRIMLVLSALLSASPVFPQILPPNTAGISAGHEHFRVTDVEAAERFWTALGGVIEPMGQVRVVKFPGIIVMLARATAETPVRGGTEGTTVDSIRFRVKNLNNTAGPASRSTGCNEPRVYYRSLGDLHRAQRGVFQNQIIQVMTTVVSGFAQHDFRSVSVPCRAAWRS